MRGGRPDRQLVARLRDAAGLRSRPSGPHPRPSPKTDGGGEPQHPATRRTWQGRALGPRLLPALALGFFAAFLAWPGDPTLGRELPRADQPTPPFPTLPPTEPFPTLPPSVPTPAPFTPSPTPSRSPTRPSASSTATPTRRPPTEATPTAPAATPTPQADTLHLPFLQQAGMPGEPFLGAPGWAGPADRE